METNTTFASARGAEDFRTRERGREAPPRFSSSSERRPPLLAPLRAARPGRPGGPPLAWGVIQDYYSCSSTTSKGGYCRLGRGAGLPRLRVGLGAASPRRWRRQPCRAVPACEGSGMSGKRPTEGCGVTCMGGGLVDGRDRDRGEGQDCEELRVEHLPGSPRRVVAEDSDEEDEGEDASDSALTAALSTMFCASGAYGRGRTAAAVPVMTYDEVMEKMRVSPASRLSLVLSFFGARRPYRPASFRTSRPQAAERLAQLGNRTHRHVAAVARPGGARLVRRTFNVRRKTAAHLRDVPERWSLVPRRAAGPGRDAVQS